MCKYELTDYQWNQINDLIPPKTSTCGRAHRNPRKLLNAIIRDLRTSAPWYELPEKYGSWYTAYNNFRKWTDEGILENIFKKFSPFTEDTDKV